MTDNTLKNRARGITALFMLTYFVSYVTRVNYGAVISEMVAVTGASKASLSIALTGSFITYGAGQVISGFAADRFSPKKLVAAGIAVTAAVNLLLPLYFSPVYYAILWCVNGFAQAMLWPPIVRLMTENFDDETYKKYSVYVTYGSSFGTAAVYLTSPLLIGWWNYKAVFFCSASIGVLMIPLWLRFAPDGRRIAEKRTVSKKANGKELRKALFAPVMIVLMLIIVLQGMLRDGVTTWMPSLIAENFDVGNRLAILSGVILPVFGVISLQITSFFYRRVFKNPLTCAGTIFAAGTAAAAALIFAAGKNVVLTVVLTATLIASMHGVNLIMTCMIPPYFKSFGRVSTVSGILNACTYIGSAISTYGIALLSSNGEWGTTLIVWCAVSALGTACCFICIKPWKNKYMKE